MFIEKISEFKDNKIYSLDSPLKDCREKKKKILEASKDTKRC